jgi:hypothetical protein
MKNSQPPVDAPDANPANRPAPVFVVGMNGSGTTMLADSLGRHPALYMFPHEVRLLPFYVQRQDRFGDLSRRENRRRLADELCSAKPFWHVHGRQRYVLGDEWLQQPGLAGAIDGVFRSFAQREGKSRWGEKSPMNVLHMQALAQVFPQAQFVHIVRDGRDAAQSFHRRFGFVAAETIYRWKHVVEEGRRQGHELGPRRYIEVGYEALTADPRAEIERICRFLGLPFDEATLQASMRMADPDLAAAGARIASNSGKWARYFTVAEQRQLERIAGRQLAALGYAVTVEGDDEPGRLRLRAWRLRGIVQRTRIQLRQYGSRGVVAYLRSAMVAWKQSRSGRL